MLVVFISRLFFLFEIVLVLEEWFACLTRERMGPQTLYLSIQVGWRNQLLKSPVALAWL